MPSLRNSPPELPDVNVLVALVVPNHVHHDMAHVWFSDVDHYVTTPVTEAGLLRVLLNPKIAGQPVPVESALAAVLGIRSDERASFLPDDASLAEARIDLAGLAGHRQVTDLHLVNLAAGNNAVLVTFDQGIREVLLPSDQGLVRLLG